MIRLHAAVMAAAAAAGLGGAAVAQGEADGSEGDVRLYRLDCGALEVADLNVFSDTEAYTGRTYELVDSCYLIRHGEDYLLWDAGLPDSIHDAEEPPVYGVFTLHVPHTLASQLQELGVAPGDIDFLGVSHGHFDHIGNANMFPDATLLIQAKEWDALFGDNAIFDSAPLSEWADGENVEKLQGDHDVFGDGSVITLSTPGHTPGHQALLVHLENTGVVILSGDVAHFTENYDRRGVPDFNTDRADTLASFDRINRLLANLGGRLIIQHEPADVDDIPELPGYLD